MDFNLIDESWMPVVTRSGKTRKIRPDQLGEASLGPDPAIAFNAPRPDLNAAYYELVIGLLQTFAMPSNEDDWLVWHDSPPTAEDVAQRLNPWKRAFNLFGDGHRFMQDFDPLKGGEKPVTDLLMDSPGAITLKHNKAHFIKPVVEPRFSPDIAAISLFAHQAYASGGGPGFRTSVRGGGPWTTILHGRTLWESLWLNVAPMEQLERWFGRAVSISSDKLASVLPWMAPTRTSKSNEETLPEDGSPLQVYWGMPRRVRLIVAEGESVCTVSGVRTPHGVAAIEAQSHGVNYSGSWRHPLTPYQAAKSGEFLSMKGTAGALSFTHWARYSFEDTSQAHAADIIRLAQQRLNDEVLDDRLGLSVRAFGYDMDNAKARCWYEGVFPMIAVAETHRGVMLARIGELLDGLDAVRESVVTSVLNATYCDWRVAGEGGKLQWVGRHPDGAKSKLRPTVGGSMEQVLEASFYAATWEYVAACGEGSRSSLNEDDWKERWIDHLHGAAMRAFDERVSVAGPAARYAAVARARDELRWRSGRASSFLRKKVGIGRAFEKENNATGDTAQA